MYGFDLVCVALTDNGSGGSGGWLGKVDSSSWDWMGAGDTASGGGGEWG